MCILIRTIQFYAIEYIGVLKHTKMCIYTIEWVYYSSINIPIYISQWE